MCVQYEFLYLILIRPELTVGTGMYLRPALALVVVNLQSQGLSRRLEKLLLITFKTHQEAIHMSNYFDLFERHAK
jgi:hypothetical protein